MANFTYKITIEPVSVGTRAELETVHFGDHQWVGVPSGKRVIVLQRPGVDNDTTKEQVIQMIQGLCVAYENGAALGGDPTSVASTLTANAIYLVTQAAGA